MCSFTVAVNRRKTKQNQDPGADYFNVSAWRELGENCAKYLAKGRKVCVVGPVSCRAFTRNDGSIGASLEVQAQDVEFLTPKGDGGDSGYQDSGSGSTGGYANGGQGGASVAPAQAADTQQAAKPAAADPSGFTPVNIDDLPF